MDQIVNKVKAQLFAKGVDNMNQLQDIFLVSLSALKSPTDLILKLDPGFDDQIFFFSKLAWEPFYSNFDRFLFVCG